MAYKRKRKYKRKRVYKRKRRYTRRRKPSALCLRNASLLRGDRKWADGRQATTTVSNTGSSYSVLGSLNAGAGITINTTDQGRIGTEVKLTSLMIKGRWEMSESDSDTYQTVRMFLVSWPKGVSTNGGITTPGFSEFLQYGSSNEEIMSPYKMNPQKPYKIWWTKKMLLAPTNPQVGASGNVKMQQRYFQVNLKFPKGRLIRWTGTTGSDQIYPDQGDLVMYMISDGAVGTFLPSVTYLLRCKWFG